MSSTHPRVVLPRTEGRCSARLEGLRARGFASRPRLLLPEGEDPRVLSAAAFLSARGWARPILLGDPGAVAARAAEEGVSLKGVDLWDAADPVRRSSGARALLEKRRAKGMTEDQAADLLKDPLYQGVMALLAGEGDLLAAGAVRTTADTVRAGFAGLGLAHGADIVFGAFLMECPADSGRLLLFADGAVSPRPSPRGLAAVAVAAGALFERWVGEPARVAFLSFSTRGSAEDESVAAIRQAVEGARKKAPGLAVDGELQGDAALVDHIALQKGAAGSPVAGRANVLVFPDLNAGNIGYKLVQHLGGARAIGPVLAGLSRPMTDLSRGCTDEDIVDAAALTALSAS
jgi:phosphate acetyltransferase